MSIKQLHPADLLVETMNRIYQNGMTTTSGGNLSILDGNGDIWITPSGVDKGTLTRDDICRVTADGTIYGPHKPSVELPFHASVYRRRPDLRAVLHAHPPALVAFSVARRLPDINLYDNPQRVIGAVSMAEYAVPGSQILGDNIAGEFERGFNAVVLENHGVCVGAENMHAAFMRFEALELCAAAEINALKLGTPQPLRGEVPDMREHRVTRDFVPDFHSPEELAARRDMVAMIRRACRQKLFSSADGVCSTRLSNGAFLITPGGADRGFIEESDLVLVKNGMKEQGKTPSRWTKLHELIYRKHEGINAIMGVGLTHAMAFAVTDEFFDPRTIPESYIILRETKKAPLSELYVNPKAVANMLSERTPMLICENSHILATGGTLLAAFDRLEVTEATAKSILDAKSLGGLVRISDGEVEDINKAFNLT